MPSNVEQEISSSEFRGIRFFLADNRKHTNSTCINCFRWDYWIAKHVEYCNSAAVRILPSTQVNFQRQINSFFKTNAYRNDHTRPCYAHNYCQLYFTIPISIDFFAQGSEKNLQASSEWTSKMKSFRENVLRIRSNYGHTLTSVPLNVLGDQIVMSFNGADYFRGLEHQWEVTNGQQNNLRAAWLQCSNRVGDSRE